MSGFIYFIRCEQFVKIGFTAKQPNIRISAIQGACPFPIEVLAVHSGTKMQESLLHQLLNEHAHGGEWFRDHSDIRNFAHNGPPPIEDATLVEELDWRVINLAAAELGIKRLARANWRRRGRIPRRWQRVISQKLEGQLSTAWFTQTSPKNKKRHRPILIPASGSAEPDTDMSAPR